jgi:hypothetical protein
VSVLQLGRSDIQSADMQCAATCSLSLLVRQALSIGLHRAVTVLVNWGESPLTTTRCCRGAPSLWRCPQSHRDA